MLKILVNGCNGKMGQILCSLIEKDIDLSLVCGVDKTCTDNCNFPIYTDISMIKESIDIIIDFSIPEATLNILKYAKNNKIPIVIATTGLSEEQENILKSTSNDIPIFRSANMSYEISIMQKVLELLSPLLKDSDIELIETHHNRKIDSPSGTALMLANTINSSLNNQYHYIYNRHEKREKREKNEIGISSIRGGNIVGEHTVQFFSEFETFEIKHTSYSRNVFAEGAIKAAKFLTSKTAGYYSMNDII